MLLSLPTWISHLLTVSEGLAVILLFRRYAICIGRLRLQWFAYAMIPHLLGGIAALGLDLSGDRADWLIDLLRGLSVGRSRGAPGIISDSLGVDYGDGLRRRRTAAFR